MSLSTSIARTQQYPSIKNQQADNDEQWRQRLIAQLRYLLDEATLQRMPLWQLRAWTAKVTPKPVEPKASELAADLIARMDKLKVWFDARVPVETVDVEPVQPVVEVDHEAVAAYKRVCESYYADLMAGIKDYDMSDADPSSDFHENENYIYKAVN